MSESVESKKSLMGRILDWIERVGNKVPNPAILFLALCLLVIVLSAILAAFDVKVTYDVAETPPVEVEQTYQGGTVEPYYSEPAIPPQPDTYETHRETTEIKSLLTSDGIAFIFTSSVQNFNNFGVVAVILVAMIGVGVAEVAGLIGALIRKLVKVSPPKTITFIIVFMGMLSSVATDAGYLVLIPLGAVAFKSIGRNPLLGIAAAFAGVSAGFAVNILITPMDGVLTEVTNESIALVDQGRSIDLTANLYFAIASTIFVTFVITYITTRLIAPRLGEWDPSQENNDGMEGAEGEVVIAPKDESRGLRLALYGLLGVLAFIALLTVPSGAPLRNSTTGSMFEDSPFMDGLIFIIMLIFLVTGICFGYGAKTFKTSNDCINAVVKTFAGLAGLIFLLLIISQFIAYFNFSNMATVAAVKLADVLESADVNALWLLIGLIVVTMILDLIIPGVIPKWAIFAPVFIPLFLRLGVAPQTVLAAYRIGDSPMNVITPLMVYFPFIVVVAQRYVKNAGVGTIVSLMIPYTAIVAATWIAFFVGWYLLDIPLGPGAPVQL